MRQSAKGLFGKVIDQQLKWDKDGSYVVYKYEDGTLLVEPVSPAEAALIHAKESYG